MTCRDPRPSSPIAFANVFLVPIRDRVKNVGVALWLTNEHHADRQFFVRAAAQQIKDFVAELSQPFRQQIVNDKTGTRRECLWMRAASDFAGSRIPVTGR